MSSITDQKIRFYLEHQEQIDEWHRLRDGVHSIADEFFASVWPDLKGLCETAGGRPIVCRQDRASSQISLYRDEWLDDGRPVALVCFEWVAGKRPDFHSSYVGILASTREAEARLKAQLEKQHLEPLFASARTDRLWPAYEEIHPEGNYWDDLEGFRAQIVGKITRWWEHSWELIDLAARH